MKLWQKNTVSLKAVENFTVGKDRMFDVLLAPYDVLGNIAHAKMLEQIGLLTEEEAAKLTQSLKNIYPKTLEAGFTIEENIEDIHSQIEWMLTQQLGDTGKKKFMQQEVEMIRYWLILNYI